MSSSTRKMNLNNRRFCKTMFANPMKMPIIPEIVQKHWMYSVVDLAKSTKYNALKTMPTMKYRKPNISFLLNDEVVGSMPKTVKCPRIVCKIFIFSRERKSREQEAKWCLMEMMNRTVATYPTVTKYWLAIFGSRNRNIETQILNYWSNRMNKKIQFKHYGLSKSINCTMRYRVNDSWCLRQKKPGASFQPIKE